MEARKGTPPQTAPERTYSINTPAGPKLVKVDPEVVFRYESCVGPFYEGKPNHLIATRGEDVDYGNDAEIARIIREGTEDEAELYSQMNEIAKLVIEKEAEQS